jgi:hypothetical protein
MVTFTPDGRYLLTADECNLQPITRSIRKAREHHRPGGWNANLTVRTCALRLQCAPADKQAEQDAKVRAEFFAKENIRVYGQMHRCAGLRADNTCCFQDSKTAWVTLQENNAWRSSISRAPRYGRKGLGTKDHWLQTTAGWGDRDNAVKIANWPVKGLYLPTAIAAYRVRGRISWCGE